jgi:uncharacterized Zn-finger protein
MSSYTGFDYPSSPNASFYSTPSSSSNTAFPDDVFSGLQLSPSGYSSWASASSTSHIIPTTPELEDTLTGGSSLPRVISSRAKQKKTYTCPHCSKCFSRPSALETHKYTHTSEKPFQCQRYACLLFF